MRIPLLLFCAALPGFAGPFSFGIKGGVPFTDFLNAARNQNITTVLNSSRYVVGPTVELHLPAGFGVEFDALYRHYDYTATITGVTTGNTQANAWEFPLLLKYKFPTPIVRPFVDAGIAWDKLSGVTQSISSVITQTPAPVNKDVTTGFVMGVGVDVHFVIHVTPEIRYTRWGSQHFTDVNGLFRSNQNQAEFLVGITF